MRKKMSESDKELMKCIQQKEPFIKTISDEHEHYCLLCKKTIKCTMKDNKAKYTVCLLCSNTFRKPGIGRRDRFKDEFRKLS